MRNKAVFDHKMMHPSSVFNRFHYDYHETNSTLQYNLVKPIIQDNLQKWQLPQKGFYKLNVDGRWKGTADAGGGGVIRSDTGSWMIGFSATYHAATPCTAEFLAIRDGLKLAKDHKITLLELETDAKNLKTMLESDLARPNNSLLPLFTDVSALLQQNWVVVVNHAPREANMVAHGLALLSRGTESNFTLHIDMPDSVGKAFRADLGNVPSSSH